MSHSVEPGDARITHLRAADRIAVPWRNGGGVTHEVFRGASVRTEFDWRVSIAEVASDGPFSAFDGLRRSIAVVKGGGMVLEFDHGESIALHPFEVHEFNGARKVRGLLTDGPVLDLNLIYDPCRVEAALQISRDACIRKALADEIVLLVNLHCDPVWCAAGEQSFELAPLDALCAHSGVELNWQGPFQHAGITVTRR